MKERVREREGGGEGGGEGAYRLDGPSLSEALSNQGPPRRSEGRKARRAPEIMLSPPIPPPLPPSLPPSLTPSSTFPMLSPCRTRITRSARTSFLPLSPTAVAPSVSYARRLPPRCKEREGGKEGGREGKREGMRSSLLRFLRLRVE